MSAECRRKIKEFSCWCRHEISKINCCCITKRSVFRFDWMDLSSEYVNDFDMNYRKRFIFMVEGRLFHSSRYKEKNRMNIWLCFNVKRLAIFMIFCFRSISPLNSSKQNNSVIRSQCETFFDILCFVLDRFLHQISSNTNEQVSIQEISVWNIQHKLLSRFRSIFNSTCSKGNDRVNMSFVFHLIRLTELSLSF